MTTAAELTKTHLASPESVYYLEEFSTVHSDPEKVKRTIQHPLRVAENVAAFAGDFVPPRLYDVAILHDVVDRFEGSTSPVIRFAAKSALQMYFQELPQNESKYVSCVMADLAIAEQVAERYRSTEALQTLDNKYKGILNPEYTGEVPKEFWRLDAPLPDVKATADLVKMTNIETHVVRAAEKIDNLWLPPERDSALFQDVLEVEYFDVPKLEIIGFDGMAMAVRDIALRTRLEKLGEYGVLEKATKLHNDAKQISVDRLFGLVVGEDNLKLEHVVGNMGREPFVEIGDFVFKDPNGKNAAGKFRIKSIGSIADKIQRYGVENAPMDIFATTIIEEDVASSAEMFASMMQFLRENKAVKPIAAKTKEKAFYAQGGEDYLKRVAKALTDRDIDLADVQFKSIDPDGYEVAKITFDLCHDGVSTPSEVQFVTKTKRHEARLGRNAHYALKAGENEVDLESMEGIYDRKSRMTPDPSSPDYLRVNGQSHERGRNLLKRVLAE